MGRRSVAVISVVSFAGLYAGVTTAEVAPQTVDVAIVEGGSKRPIQAIVSWSSGSTKDKQKTASDGKIKLTLASCSGAVTIQAQPVTALLNGRERTINCGTPTVEIALAKNSLASIYDAAIMASASVAREGSNEMKLTQAINTGDFASAATLSNELAARSRTQGRTDLDRSFGALAMEFGFRAAGVVSPSDSATGLIRFDPVQKRVVTSKLGESFLKGNKISATGKWDNSAFKAAERLQGPM